MKQIVIIQFVLNQCRSTVSLLLLHIRPWMYDLGAISIDNIRFPGWIWEKDFNYLGEMLKWLHTYLWEYYLADIRTTIPQLSSADDLYA